MDGRKGKSVWIPGTAPVAVVMISLNEGHNMEAVLENLSGWAQEVFLVDSKSADSTVDIALRYGVKVVQRDFLGFGDQWNFALKNSKTSAPWTMKMDPDERLTDELKREIEEKLKESSMGSYRIPIRLCFMGRRLPSVLHLTRLWRTGTARFSDVRANEHAHCPGPEASFSNEIRHLDSPSLDHWVTKQNRYTTAEAASQFEGLALAVPPRFFGNSLERRIWLKKNFWKIPGRYKILFLYHFFYIGAWRAGRVGWVWSHLRTEVYRMWEYKKFEMERLGRVPAKIPAYTGVADSRVSQF